MDVILEAALGGGGLACVPERIVARHIETGRLVRVLEAWCRPIALRAFIDFLRSDPNENNLSGEKSASAY
jgi:DNA-binding transcriptional LysR family regulator